MATLTDGPQISSTLSTTRSSLCSCCPGSWARTSCASLASTATSSSAFVPSVFQPLLTVADTSPTTNSKSPSSSFLSPNQCTTSRHPTSSHRWCARSHKSSFTRVSVPKSLRLVSTRFARCAGGSLGVWKRTCWVTSSITGKAGIKGWLLQLEGYCSCSGRSTQVCSRSGSESVDRRSCRLRG
jgi:hypothetical protein